MIELVIEFLFIMVLAAIVTVLILALAAVAMGCVLVMRFLLKCDRFLRWVGWPKVKDQKTRKR